MSLPPIVFKALQDSGISATASLLSMHIIVQRCDDSHASVVGRRDRRRVLSKRRASLTTSSQNMHIDPCMHRMFIRSQYESSPFITLGWRAGLGVSMHTYLRGTQGRRHTED